MEQLQLLIFALEKAVKQDVYNKLEINAIQSALDNLSGKLNTTEDEKENTDN